MATVKNRAFGHAAMLIAALAIVFTMAGCQMGSPNNDGTEGTPEPLLSESEPISFEIDAATREPSEVVLETPLPSSTAAELSIKAAVDEYSDSELEHPHWLRDAKFDNEYAAILHQLEYETLMILVGAAETGFDDKEAMPRFDELKSELLRYNIEQRLDPWQYIYENNPGWLMEPRELLYAVNMYEPSLEISRDDEDKVRLNFKTFGQSHQPHVVSRHMEIELIRSEESWRIGDMKSRAAEYAFTKEDAEHILLTDLNQVSSIGDDEDYFLFQDEEGREYKFHKRNGYYSSS